MPQPTLAKRAIAELIGTFVLVFLGTGSVVTVVTRLGFLGPTGGEGTALVPGACCSSASPSASPCSS